MIAWIAWTCVDCVVLRGPLRHLPRRLLHRSRHNTRSEHPSCQDSGGHSHRDLSCRRIPSRWPSKERKSYAPRRRSPSRDRRGGPSYRCEPSACDSHLELAVHREFAVLRSPGSFLSVLFITNVRILSLLGLTRQLPSVFSDPSYPLARVWDYLSMSSVAWFDDVCFYEVSVLPPLASTEIGVVQVGRFRVCCSWKSLEIHGADSIGIHSGTKNGDAGKLSFYLIRSPVLSSRCAAYIHPIRGWFYGV